MNALRELILQHGDKTEATSYPFWAIVLNGLHGKQLVSNGFWFSREAAEAELKANKHRYSKSAYVYCFSGHQSPHVRALYVLAREGQE